MPDPLDGATPIQTSDPLDGAVPVQRKVKAADPLAGAVPVQAAKSQAVPAPAPQAAAQATEPDSVIEGFKHYGGALADKLKLKEAYEWGKQQTPWRIMGVSDEDYAKMGVLDKLKISAQGNAKMAEDVAMSPLRVVSGFGRQLIKAGAGAAEAGADVGEKIGSILDKKGILPRDNTQPPMSQQIAQAVQPITHPSTAAMTNQEKMLVEPATLPGKTADLGGEAGMMFLQGAATGGAGAASKIINPAIYFGGKGGLEGYETATQAGAPVDKKLQYAGGSAGLNAIGAVLPISPAMEETAGALVKSVGIDGAKKWLASKVGASAADAYLYTVAQNRLNQTINPEAKPDDTKGYLPNLAMMLGLKGVQGVKEATGPESFAKFQEGRATPTGSGETRSSVETEMQALPIQLMGDQAAAIGIYNRLTNKYSPEVREEALHWADLKNAGLPAPALSKGAEAFWNDPEFVHARTTQANRYALAQAQKGKEIPQDSPYYVPRVVQEGVQPEGEGTMPSVRTSASSLKARSFMAYTEPNGKRTLVHQNEAGDYEDADGNVIPAGSKTFTTPTPQELTADAPPVKSGFTRLYRADSPTTKFDDVFNREGLVEFASDKPGTRYTDDLKYANYFKKSYGSDAKITYIDVPSNLAEPLKINEYEYKVPDKIGGAIGHATTAEIEAAIPGIKYRKDPLMNTLESTVQLGGATRGMDFIDSVKNNPKWAAPAGMENAPEGWKGLSESAQVFYPQLQGVKMEPRMAKVFETLAAERAKPDSPSFVKKLNDVATQVGFTLPTLHLPNEINHAIKSLGAEGMTTGLLTGRVQKNMDRAAKALASLQNGQPNQDAVDLLSSGAPLQANREVPSQWFGELAKSPSINQTTAPFQGMAEQGKNPIASMNQRYTWTPDNVIRWGLIMDYAERKGMSLADAAREVNRTYPSYKVTQNELGDSPKLSGLNDAIYTLGKNATVGNTPLLRFMPYRISALRSVGTTAKDLAAPAASMLKGEPVDSQTMNRSVDAANKIGGLGIATVGMGATMTPLIQALTRDEKTKYRQGGSTSVVQDLGATAKGLATGNLPAVGSEAMKQLNLSPAVAEGLDFGGRGFQGRTPANPLDILRAKQQLLANEPGKAAETEGKALADQAKALGSSAVYSVGPAAQALSGEKDTASVLGKLLLAGKRDLTPAEEAAQSVFANRAPRYPKPASEADALVDRLKMTEALKSKDMDAVEALAQRGNLHPKEIQNLIQGSSLSRTQKLAASMKTMDLGDALLVYREGDDTEKKAMLPMLMKKYQKAKADNPDKAEAARELQKASATP